MNNIFTYFIDTLIPIVSDFFGQMSAIAMADRTHLIQFFNGVNSLSYTRLLTGEVYTFSFEEFFGLDIPNWLGSIINFFPNRNKAIISFLYGILPSSTPFVFVLLIDIGGLFIGFSLFRIIKKVIIG